MDVPRLLERIPDYQQFWTLEELRGRTHDLCRTHPGVARVETVGMSREGRPIDLVSVGHGRRSVLLVGVPHPNEPIGTLTIDFLTRLLAEDDDLRRALDVTLHAIVVADPDGLVLNEGWMQGAFTPGRYAREFYRPPHREQVEWSFPVSHETLVFTTPSPETQTVMRVMERTRPELFYGLHNAGFCGVYFYVTDLCEGLASGLGDVVQRQGLALHRGEPEVPYLETLAPAIYRLFGIADTYAYLQRTLGEDPAPLIEAGTCSDDWLTRIVPGAFSIVCEVPYYTAPALADDTPSTVSRRDAVVAGLDRSLALHGEAAAAFATIADRAPDHRLTRSVVDYLAKAPKRLAAQRAHAASEEYARLATVAEQMDATVCAPFYHALYLGEVHRVARLVGAGDLATRVGERVDAIMDTIAREASLTVLPIRPLVAVQAGAGLVAMDVSGSRATRLRGPSA